MRLMIIIVEIWRLALKHNYYYNAGSEDIMLLVPEAQPRDTNSREVLLILITVGCKRFIMVRSVAEGPENLLEWVIISQI